MVTVAFQKAMCGALTLPWYASPLAPPHSVIYDSMQNALPLNFTTLPQLMKVRWRRTAFRRASLLRAAVGGEGNVCVHTVEPFAAHRQVWRGMGVGAARVF
jgi:hypothetical protein